MYDGECWSARFPDFSPASKLEIWCEIYFFWRSLATVLPGGRRRLLNSWGLPELLNPSSAGAKALLLQKGLYRRRQLFDIRRLRTRSFRGVVHEPDFLNDRSHPVLASTLLAIGSARLRLWASRTTLRPVLASSLLASARLAYVSGPIVPRCARCWLQFSGARLGSLTPLVRRTTLPVGAPRAVGRLRSAPSTTMCPGRMVTSLRTNHLYPGLAADVSVPLEPKRLPSCRPLSSLARR